MTEAVMYDRVGAKTRDIEQALARLGEPVSEAQARTLAAREDCDCKEGMFALAPSRRQLFGGAGVVAAVGMTAMLPRAQVTAYILAEAKIIESAAVLDAETRPKVQMPNRDGFIPDPRPELFR